MAKGKYHEWLKKENLIKIKGWAMDGLSNKQIAHNIGINEDTLYTWQKKYTEFAEALKKSKEVADREVENAMHKSANGYFVEEIKKEWRLLYPKLSEINEVISSLSNVIRYSVMDNFDRWDILGQYTVLVMLVSFNTWDEEVRYASTFFNKRKEWLNSILNN